MFNSNSIIQEILGKLKGVEEKGDGYVSLCPCHDDKNNPNLQITITEEAILMYCFACGAKGKDVMKQLGLPVGKLFLKNKGYKRRKGFSWL